MFPQLLNNYYMRPMYKRPYYYINNVNISNTFPVMDSQVDVIGNSFTITLSGNVTPETQITFKHETNSPELVIGFTSYSELIATLRENNITAIYIGPQSSPTGIAVLNVYSVVSGGSSITVSPYNVKLDAEKTANLRYGNKSKVRMEIRYGKDNTIFELWNVYIDYLKVPQFIRLTIDQVEEVEDNSQTLEYPDYVCQEIVNELVKLIMENESNPRLQTSIPVNQSIAMPGQEQQKR